MDTSILFFWMTVLAIVILFSKSSHETNELEEINIFVQSVLAMADRKALGLPDRTMPIQNYGSVIDGQLPVELLRYLERLVSVSSALDKQTLVTMLWDDSIIIDENQEPHTVFDQHQSHGDNKNHIPATNKNK